LQQKLLGIIFAPLIAAMAVPAMAQSDLPDILEMQTTDAEPLRLSRYNHDEIDIKIDGHLNDSVWLKTIPFGDLRVIEPDTLAEPPYDTNIRIAYTERGMFVAFDMEQPEETIVERIAPRDGFGISRDHVGFTIDTSGDGRYGYWFNLSLGDTQMDGTILPERQYRRDWDGAWYGATQRTDRGWSAEFYIPWSQVAMPKQDGLRRFGLYVTRQVAHLNERWAYPGLPNSLPRFMSILPKIEFENVDPRQQWSLFPYASATYDRVVDDTRYKAGADIFWRPSSNFQMTATINPDFGSVESDDVVVNFTANETFFPEKRLFFQEGSEIFNISGRQSDFGMQPVRIVNTRRIGGQPREPLLPPGVELSDREELRVAGVDAALKATGQLGSVRYGVLAAVEDTTEFVADDDMTYLQDGRDFGVVRMLYEDSQGAAYRGLGWVSTLVAHPESDAVVHGADLHYLTTSGTWNFNGQIFRSSSDDEGSGNGVLGDATYSPRQGIKHTFRLSSLDDKVDVNDFGFQQRNDADDLQYSFEWIKSGMSRIRNFRMSPFFRYEVNGDGHKTNNGYGLSGNATLNNLANVGTFMGYFPGRYDDRNSFDNGTFRIDKRIFFDLNYRTDPSRPVSLFGKVGHRGESLGGHSIETELGLAWRPLYNLNLELKVKHNDRDGWLLHQEDQNFTTFVADQWQPELRLEFFPSSSQQLRMTLQWVGIQAVEDEFFVLPQDSTVLVPVPKPPGPSDDFSVSQLNFQIRYRWQIAPLSDLFIVYTKGDFSRDNLNSFDEMFRDSWNNPIGDQIIIKLRYRIGS
jgi:hypothetical protein